MKRKISILGSTGSIGRQALEVIEKLRDKFEIIALTGGSNDELLNEQIARFKPKYAYSSNPSAIVGAKYLSLDEICSNKENDIILVAVSGRIGLKPTITAINNGIDIAYPQVVLNYPNDKEFTSNKETKKKAEKFTLEQKELSRDLGKIADNYKTSFLG